MKQSRRRSGPPHRQLLVIIVMMTTIATLRYTPSVHAVHVHSGKYPRFGTEVAPDIFPDCSWGPTSRPRNTDADVNTARVRCPLGTLGRVDTIKALGGGYHQRRSRTKRPLSSFIAPGMIWLLAAYIDYSVWWTLMPSAVATTSSAGHLHDVMKAIAAHSGHFALFHVLLALALLSHLATMVADPGFLPSEAVLRAHGKVNSNGPGHWCDRCQNYKPPRAHHCRRCGACVARMDHHCIYAANCVGAGNHKQFLLLLVYSGACAAHTLILSRQFFWSRLASPSASILYRSLLAGGYESGSSGGDQRFPYRSVDGGMLLCSGLAVMLLLWLVILFVVQCHGITVEAGTVDRMQRQRQLAAKLAGEQRIPVAQANDKQSTVERLLSLSAAAPSPSMRTSSRQESFVSALARFFRINGFDATISQPDLPPGTRLATNFDCGMLRRWSKAMREEVLGEGPWMMWFLPTRAELSPQAWHRVYCGTDEIIC